MLSVTSLFGEIKASPFEEQEIVAPHTDVVTFGSFKLRNKVTGSNGIWKERPGTLIVTITRERNLRPLNTVQKGEVCAIHSELEGIYVQASIPLATIRHSLSKDEVLRILFRQALNLFVAPGRAKYYFVPQIDTKIKVLGCRSVSVYEGTELFIASRMKQRTPLYYIGPDGLIYTVYFKYNENMDAGSPLTGVYPPDQSQQVKEVVLKVQTEWRGQE